MKTFYFLVIFLFSSFSSSSNTRPSNFEAQCDTFMSVLEMLLEANHLSNEMPNVKTEDEENLKTKAMLNLIRDAINKSAYISDDFLNYLYPDLSMYFRNKLINGNKLYVEGLNADDPIISYNLQVSSFELMNDWGTFWEKSNKEILSKLDEKVTPETTIQQKKSFWRVLLRLIIGVIVMSVGWVLISLLDRLGYIGIILVALIAIYLWWLWSAYCVFITSTFGYLSFIYIVTCLFFVVVAGICILRAGFNPEDRSLDNAIATKVPSLFSGIALSIPMLVFLIWPKSLYLKIFSWSYGWMI